jgi:hypothetical protein
MAFADPQSVTISGAATSLPRTLSNETHSQYTKDDQTVTLRVMHSDSGKRRTDAFSLKQTKIAADPFVTGLSKEEYIQVNISVNRPKAGFTVTEAKALVDAILAYASASTGAKITQLLGGEH